MKTAVVIQARMGSTRLPGKVLRLLGNKTILSHVVERISMCKLVDCIIIATTTLPEDDLIVDEAKRLGVFYYRGDEYDVLSRYYEASEYFHVDSIVRVTSDCPFIDPDIVDTLIQKFHEKNVDYASNFMNRTFPRGLDAEIFTIAALRKTYKEAVHPEHREHVTPYLYQHPEMFSTYSYFSDKDHSFHRWTLDTIEDWKLISTVYERLNGISRWFGLKDILNVFQEDPSLVFINNNVEQKKLETDGKNRE
ncbi:cytidylyltransferase domain-containing protein [Paenibacillus planticolens]|uniref:NTP transferase domain-containing protein n=1 Tax=Paenibacillus planticolens TaxID=2654976 RepID=A0ABX1ZK84_9BACL|nr:glycosyltransferase family protein [Paenibacillus planticolens]NOV00466.1 NTP transferase domain-containing protein [Paenibacillus planticolens]